MKAIPSALYQKCTNRKTPAEERTHTRKIRETPTHTTIYSQCERKHHRPQTSDASFRSMNWIALTHDIYMSGTLYPGNGGRKTSSPSLLPAYSEAQHQYKLGPCALPHPKAAKHRLWCHRCHGTDAEPKLQQIPRTAMNGSTTIVISRPTPTRKRHTSSRRRRSYKPILSDGHPLHIIQEKRACQHPSHNGGTISQVALHDRDLVNSDRLRILWVLATFIPTSCRHKLELKRQHIISIQGGVEMSPGTHRIKCAKVAWPKDGPGDQKC